MAIQSSRLQLDNQQARERAELLYGLAAAVIRAEQRRAGVRAPRSTRSSRALGANRSSMLAFDRRRRDALQGAGAACRTSTARRSRATRRGRATRSRRADDRARRRDRPVAGAVTCRCSSSERIGALGFIPLVAAARLIGKFMVYYDAAAPARRAPSSTWRSAIANHVAAALARFARDRRARSETVRFNEMFTGILGHDLRNPLGAIMTAAQLVLMRDDERADAGRCRAS